MRANEKTHPELTAWCVAVQALSFMKTPAYECGGPRRIRADIQRLPAEKNPDIGGRAEALVDPRTIRGLLNQFHGCDTGTKPPGLQPFFDRHDGDCVDLLRPGAEIGIVLLRRMERCGSGSRRAQLTG